MLTVGLGGGGQGEDLFGIQAAGRLHAGDGGLALGQGAGLVEEHRVDLAHGLQGEAVLDQDAAAGGALGGDGHDQRDRQTQRMGAGDDEDSDGANDRVVGEPEERPDDGGDQRSSEGEPEQQGRSPVGDALGTGG